ncbi:MAG: hypothetical protein J0I12_34745 [Candidatus Eremiobacteraeota bacterium]|nr:hypothetical protein [Candidatus Eremiobacteraeota bacterium]
MFVNWQNLVAVVVRAIPGFPVQSDLDRLVEEASAIRVIQKDRVSSPALAVTGKERASLRKLLRLSEVSFVIPCRCPWDLSLEIISSSGSTTSLKLIHNTKLVYHRWKIPGALYGGLALKRYLDALGSNG